MAYTSLKPAGTGTPTWPLPAAHRQVPLPGLYQPSTGNVTCLIVHRLFFEVQLEPLEEHLVSLHGLQSRLVQAPVSHLYSWRLDLSKLLISRHTVFVRILIRIQQFV